MVIGFFLIGFLASVIGSICGIGGGVLIKPALDFTNFASSDTVSFLSGITVLFMSAYSTIVFFLSKEKFDYRIAIPLAIGAGIGGILGKNIFQIIQANAVNKSTVGAIQSIILIIICIITIFYTLNPPKNKTIESTFVCLLVGLSLGIISSFLGIGGGPFNLLVLSFFFSLDTKQAGIYSLFIIFVSQVFSLLSTLITNSIPNYEPSWLIVLAFSGVMGGMIGGLIKKQLNLKKINILFISLLIFIILISFVNMMRFLNNI